MRGYTGYRTLEAALGTDVFRRPAQPDTVVVEQIPVSDGHFEERPFTPAKVWVSQNDDRDSSKDERPGTAAHAPGDYNFPNLLAQAPAEQPQKMSLEDVAKRFSPGQLFSMWVVSLFQR